MPRIPNPKKILDDDVELIKAINSGQSQRFFELVKKYEQKLYNFGLRVCGNSPDAEDLVQETFLNAFRYLKNFRYETKFKNWLYKIAISICIKKQRKSKYAPEKELSFDEFIPKDESKIPLEMPNWASVPLDNLLNRELGKVIEDAILSLPEKYRLVMVLRDVEEFTTSETAQILKITPSTVKVRLHRARLYVRESLRSYFENDRRNA